MNPLSPYLNQIKDMKEKGLFMNIKTLSSPQGAWFTVDGKKVLNFCSNNYLGFAADERLKKAAIAAIEKYGVGTGAVRPLSGNSKLHNELEEKVAKWKNVEAALIIQGGYVANLAAIQTLVSKEDIVVSDELNHASIIDGIRMAQVKRKFIYKHADMVDLKSKLEEIKQLDLQPKKDGNPPLVLIITDGVFSMDGDIAPLDKIVALAKEYGAITMVDDAHGEGVLGSHGRGIVDHFGLHGQVDIEIGTFSKALGVMGGVLAGKRDLIDYYRQRARQFLFSTSISVPDTAALIKAVEILDESDELVKKLWENAKYLKSKFQAMGFDTGKTETPITPVMVGDENKAAEFSKLLYNQGVFATPIKFPMVAMGTARIRVMPSAVHTRKDLDFGLKMFKQIGKQLKLI